MRPALLEHFPPRCPRCRSDAPLHLEIYREHAGAVLDGLLVCAGCGARHPIIDGVPVLLAELDRYLTDAAVYLLTRDDLPDELADLLGRHMPPGAWFDSTRQYLSTYGRDHWGALASEDRDDPPPGAAWRLAEIALAAAGPVSGPIVELGCAAGGVLHALATTIGAPALGIDMSAPLLRLARRALETGEATYPRRARGTAYRTQRVIVPPSRHAGVWLADALAPPLAPGRAGLVVALNLLDCVAEPAALLRVVAELLRPGGTAFLSTPFDWSAAATPAENWVGARGIEDPPADLAAMVRQTAGLDPVAVLDNLPWTLRLHDRSVMHYRVSLVVARKPLLATAA